MVRDPWITTDRCVDTSSLSGIVAGVTRASMSDEEKALALFHWFRRVIFHHRQMGEDRRDVLRLIHGYGYALCGSQAAVLAFLLRAAGLRTRIVAIRGGGHTLVEVFYGGRWHAMDPMTAFFVYDRRTPRKLASLEEMAADPT